MTTLIFEHQGWTVATSAWSAAAKTSGRTTLSYVWGAALGFTPNSTGTAQVELAVDIAAFLRLIERGGTVDLRAVGKTEA